MVSDDKKFSGEIKDKGCQYKRERCKNLSENEKKELGEYRK